MKPGKTDSLEHSVFPNDREGKDKSCGWHGLSGIALNSSDLTDIHNQYHNQ